MSLKTLFIIIATAALTIILVNNTDDMELWFFGTSKIPKLAIFGTLLGLGFILGFIAGRPGKRQMSPQQEEAGENDKSEINNQQSFRRSLSDEDKEYIS